MEEYIRFPCPNPTCGKRLKAPLRQVGRQARCSCGQSVVVPSPELLPLDESLPPPAGSLASGPHPSNTSQPRLPIETLSSRRLRLWLVAGAVGVLAAVGIGVWLLLRDSDEIYTGPPPPIELAFTGIKVADTVPFGGEVEIRNGQIMPPRAPAGYEFVPQKGALGAWKPVSGTALVVSCKITVTASAPKLEKIRLLRGKAELAALDGVAQPGFEEATAKDLNTGLAELHKTGKTPKIGLVFRVADKAAAKASNLAIEVRWLDEQGQAFSKRFSLKGIPQEP